MKLEIYKPENPQTVKLALVPAIGYTEGTIAVAIVDDKGNRIPNGYLMFFFPDGTYRPAQRLNTSLPFQTTGQGEIVNSKRRW